MKYISIYLSTTPIENLDVLLDLEKENFELLKLPFKVPNKIMISRKPYKKFINYLESEFGKNLIVYFDKKNLKFYVVDSRSIYNFCGQKIESKISEIERKLAKFVSQKVEEIIDKFSIDRIFISSPNEKIENLVISYFSKRALKLFKGFLSFQENDRKLFEKLINKVEELDIKLAVVSIENVIKNDSGIFYHKEFDFECSDIEITDDITDYLKV